MAQQQQQAAQQVGVVQGSTELQPYYFPTLIGGLLQNPDEILIPDQYTPDCLNVVFHRGVVQKRYGFVKIGAEVPGLFQTFVDYTDLNNTVHHLGIATSGLYELDGSLNWVLKQSLNGTEYQYPPYWIFNGTFIFTSGQNDPVYQYDGTTVTALGGGAPDSAKFILGLAGHLLLGSVTVAGVSHPFRIQWSDFNNQNNWTSGDAGLVDLLDNTNDPFMCLVSLANVGVLGRRGSIWSVFPTNAPLFYEFIKTVDGTGVAATGSVRMLPNAMIFLDDGDFYVFDTAQATNLGNKLHTLIGSISPEAYGSVVSAVSRTENLYYCALPTAGSDSPNVVLVYDFLENWMTLWKMGDAYDPPHGFTGAGSISINMPLIWDRWNTAPWQDWNVKPWSQMDTIPYRAFIVANGGAAMIQTGGYQDPGAPVNAFVKTKMTNYSQLGTKRTTRCQLILDQPSPGESAQVTVDCSDDGTSITFTQTYTETVTFGNSVWLEMDDLPAAEWFQFTVYNALGDQGLGLKQIVAWYVPRGSH
jgi:hypothetical protein